MQARVSRKLHDSIEGLPKPVLPLIGDWIEDYNESHPHSGLKWRLPREFIKAKTETA